MSDNTLTQTTNGKVSQQFVDSDGLTPNELQFIQEYLVDLNGRAAAVRAGFSERSAHVASSRMLNDVRIAWRIQEAIEARAGRTQLTADMVIRELMTIGLSDISNYVIDDNGHVDIHPDAPSEATRAIKAIDRTVRYDQDGNEIIETKITLWDKNSALNLLAKHLGLLIERHAHLIKGEIQVNQTWNIGGQEITF